MKMRISTDTSRLCRPRILYVNPVSLSDNVKALGSISRETGTSIRDDFYRGFVREVFKDILILKEGNLEWYDDPENRIMILDLSITHLKKGNGLLRYMIGFGLGQTDLQLEGRLYDHRTAEEAMAFAIRLRHMGNSYQGLNPRALSSPYCLRMSGQEAAISLSKLVREIWDNIDRKKMADPWRLAAWER
ncbi:DUF4410 domain-containing protein [Candidatus Sumerlaeota bacterium]|nr:DUF4410 domain-containing protein [Candidatus Sumerlaeota bacterium]